MMMMIMTMMLLLLINVFDYLFLDVVVVAVSFLIKKYYLISIQSIYSSFSLFFYILFVQRFVLFAYSTEVTFFSPSISNRFLFFASRIYLFSFSFISLYFFPLFTSRSHPLLESNCCPCWLHFYSWFKHCSSLTLTFSLCIIQSVCSVYLLAVPCATFLYDGLSFSLTSFLCSEFAC